MTELFEYAGQFLSGTEFEVFKLIILTLFVSFGLKLVGWCFGSR